MRWNDGRGPLPPPGLSVRAWRGTSPIVARFPRVATGLYRFFDTTGRVLYIGITQDPETRHQMHSEEADWWHLQARVTWEWFASRALAESAERAAIKTERPLYNLVHSIPGHGRKASRALPERQPVPRRKRPALWTPTAVQEDALEALGHSIDDYEFRKAVSVALDLGVPTRIVASIARNTRRATKGR